MPALPPPRTRRPLPGRALALAAAAALALPAAASAQEPAAAGTLASVEVLTGGDYTLEAWRDAATGDIALIDADDADEGVAWARGNSLTFLDEPPDAEVNTYRYHGRADLSRAIRSVFGITLEGVEAALAAGAPAPPPERASASLALEASVPPEDVHVSDHFGTAARTLARAAGRPVAWAGPRRLGLSVRQTSLYPGEDRGGSVTYVSYGRGPIPFPGFCDVCFSIGSAPVGSPAAREFTGGRPFTMRIAGRPALDSPIVGGVAVRLGPLVVMVDESLGKKRLRKVVGGLRIIRAARP